MIQEVRNFCKSNNLKFEDFNETSGILVTSKIGKLNRLKDNFASKKESFKYRFFEYFKVESYKDSKDFVMIYHQKMPINYTGTILTANMINFLKEKIN